MSVFASTLMHAKDFFHLASLRHGKQLGQGQRRCGAFVR